MQRLGGIAGVEQGSDSVVGEVGEPERGAFAGSDCWRNWPVNDDQSAAGGFFILTDLVLSFVARRIESA